MKPATHFSNLSIQIFFLAAVLIGQGCAHHFAIPADSRTAVYQVAETDLATRPPAFVVYAYEEEINRIGSPVVRTGAGSEQTIEIDTAKPALYVMQRSFTTPKASYTNWIYRIHFPGVPFSLIPFNLTAGRNSGIMVVVTYNQQQQPVLVTTVHTCGCYMHIVPTNFLPEHAFPQNWQNKPQDVYGETLPALLDFESVDNPILLVHLQPEVHRVMNLEVIDQARLESREYGIINLSFADMDDLQQLATDIGSTTSFYHKDGWRKGYVKGSFKPLETLFLSWLSLDLFVGSDKIYADPHIWNNRFYTSLKPWRRQESDMWDFPGFLKYWGWRL